MNPLELNSDRLKPADPVIDGPKIMQRADIVWSKMQLEPGEYLLVKVGRHAAPALEQIHAMVNDCFKKEGDRVIVFVDGDVSFEKVNFKQ